MPPGQPGTIVRAEPDDVSESDEESITSSSGSGSGSDEGGIVIDFKGPGGGGNCHTRL